MWRSKTRSAMLVACLLLSGFWSGPSRAGMAEPSSFRDNPALLQATPDAHPDVTNGIEVLWRVATTTQISSLPLVAQGAVYVRSDDTLYALDAATGMEWWRFKTEPQFSTSPVMVGGVVYIGSAGGNFYAVDARTGTERWRFTTGRDIFSSIISSPAVADGVVYIGSWDGNMHALDAATGAEQWRFATGNPIFSLPAVVDGVVYVESGILHALDAATGAEQWRFTTGDETFLSPVVADGVVYVGSTDGNVYALDAALGTERWRFMVGSFSFSPLVVDGVVYVGRDDGNLVALDAAMGTERWRFTSGDAMLSSPVVVDNVVYVNGGEHVDALNAATGTEQWRFEVVDAVRPTTEGPSFSTPPVVVDDVVYVGDFDGNVYALDAATGAERWRVRIESWSSASATVADDVVYVGASDGNVYALGARPLTLEAGGQAVVTRDGTVLRGAPAVSGVKRATLTKATAVTLTGEAVYTGNLTWWPVTVDDTGELGWIVADELEPTANRPSATPSALPVTSTLTPEPATEETEAVDDQVVEPTDGTVIETDDTEVVQPIGEIETAEENDGDSAQDLGTAPEVSSLASVPGDPAGRLHIDQDGQPIFSSTPGGVSFTRDGLALEQREVDDGAAVFVCDEAGACVDVTSASADGFHTDYPLGWLGSTFIYERVGEDGEVSFRVVALADGSLDVVEDREIGSGGSELVTLTRSYAVDDGLLVPAPAAWLLISTEGVRQIDGNPYGDDIIRIRTAPAAGTIAYLAGGQIVIASVSAPGTPEAVIPFAGTDYALAPDGSRVAVTDGSTIRVLDRTGREVASFANEAGIAIGGIAWGEDGIIFVDQSSGVLRVIQP